MNMDIEKEPYIIEWAMVAMAVLIVVLRLVAWARFHCRFVWGDNPWIALGWKGGQ